MFTCSVRRGQGSRCSILLSPAFISCCQCFAGGVFLAALTLDLLPDLEQKIEQVYIYINIV